MGAPKSDTAALQAPPLQDDPAPPSVEAVLAAAAAGERWAHAALYDLLYPVVARTLQKVLRDAASDYEDLVQASFERIVRTLTSERARPIANLAAWAGAIAAHVALDALRARMRERRLFERAGAGHLALESVPAPNLEHQLEARKQLEWLRGSLARMNAEQAQTLVLHDVLGYGLAEVAQLTGVSVAAAQRRLSRGHADLFRRARAHGFQVKS